VLDSKPRMPFIDLQAQRALIEEGIQSAIGRVLEHGEFIAGPEVQRLEGELAQWTGVPHVISCANGTDALVLALLALGIGHGDAVFVPSFTFVATAEAVVLVGAVPVFVDVDPQHMTMSDSSLRDAIVSYRKTEQSLPRAVIAVDLFGHPADYDVIREVTTSEGLFLIADAAQSFGARYHDRPVGSLADITTTSFFPAKPLGCYGDGGAVFTSDPELADIIRSISRHGQGNSRYEHVRIGTNSRLDTIQAAILLEKLKLLPDEIPARNQIAKKYDELLCSFVNTPKVMDAVTSAWAQYTLFDNNRNHILRSLANNGIPATIYYPTPLHRQAPYQAYPTAPDGLPVTDAMADGVFSIPMHPYLDDETQDLIATTIRCACDVQP
jgi:dTDP-4-amino-4,6-dideoxygalactose transaminase